METTTSKADDLRRLIRRLDPNSVQVFQGALGACASRTHYEVTPEHLLLRLLDDTGDVRLILDAFKVDRAPLRRAIQRVLEGLPTGHTTKPVLSPKLVELFSAASNVADEGGYDQIRTGLLMLAIVMNPGHMKIGEFTPELERIDIDQLRDHFREIIRESAGPQGGAAGGPAGEHGGAPAGGTALEQFTIDLTAKAAAGNIDPVFGREFEIRQMIDIFSRRRKNNPILVGEPGTGKTAIVEGLALRIVSGDVPPLLKGVKLINLDMGLLQAGASVKGEFENRLKNVIKEIKASEQPIITFIDEAHTLIGAGGAAGGSDAANLLKPALARGELRTVAATTWAEYKKYFEKDAALERRFQLVKCEEPSVENTIVMLRGLKDKYEKHHKVVMLDEAIRAAAELSNRYINGRFLPDKAVDLLDTSAARVAVSLTTQPGSLEDLDRQLNSIDTALNAIERDVASGMPGDESMLGELRENREKLVQKRAELEARWQKELEAARKVNELRSGLPAFKTDGQNGDTKAAPAEGKPAEPAKPAAPPVDETQLRSQINEALGALKAVQGQDSLVHPHVDASSVASVVADWTGIPVGKMVKNEIEAILQIEDRLRKRVVGQDHALAIIAQKLRSSKSGLGNPTQPMGVFLCVGPSGVGKTELALSIADLIFGGERFTVTINMSEFMEKHTVSQLKGSPPGYVGYGEGGVLTEAVRQRPYSVVLLDEVEKAHPDVLNLFYQVFDKGMLADGEGREINFKNTVVILTSNLGTDVIQGMAESGEAIDPAALKEAIYPHLREHFKPALVARMTVIPFLPLKQDVLKDIARIKVGKISKRLAEIHKIQFIVEEPVFENIASKCTQIDVGARNIDHILDQQVLPELSKRMLEAMTGDTMPKTITMGCNETGEYTYAFA